MEPDFAPALDRGSSDTEALGNTALLFIDRFP
jgi:hypothetical protein